MKKLLFENYRGHFFLLLTLLLYLNGISQRRPELEFTPYVKFDSYPDFSYSTNNGISSYLVSIKGTSWGFDLSFKQPVSKKYQLKAGLGYYRFAFNKISSTNRSGQTFDTRIIEKYYPPDPLTPSLFFSTDKYWYNTIVFTLGAERLWHFNSRSSLAAGLHLRNLATYSALYHIDRPPSGDDYKVNKFRYFGLSTEIFAAYYQRLGKVSIGPAIQCPVFSNWKKDDVFPGESNGDYRSKWLKGFAAGLTAKYSL